MRNVVLARIDDRLIHGQVMTGWIQYSQASEVVIVDNVVAKDEFTKMIMKSAMPKKIALSVLNEKQAVEYLLGEETVKGKKYFILVKTPQVILNLMNAGVPIGEVCIGGMGAKPNRKSFYRNISASEEEKQCFQDIAAKGAHVFAQVLSDNAPVQLSQIIG